MIYCIKKEGLSPLPSGSLDYLSSGGKSSSATLFNYKDSKVETRTFYGDNGFKKKKLQTMTIITNGMKRENLKTEPLEKSPQKRERRIVTFYEVRRITRLVR